MSREKITRRQKDISKLLREKESMRKYKLEIFKKKRKIGTGTIFIFILLIKMVPLPIFASASGVGEAYGSGGFKFSLPFGKKYNYDGIFVKKVIDGDTIELENRERVRLIGIDTPEIHRSEKLERDIRRTKKDRAAIIAMGEKAALFTKSIAEGKKVRLEFDVEKKDKYGRTLAYAYLPDGKMLNAEIIKAGYGQVYTFPPNVKYTELFLKLQREARENKRGLWGE